VHHNVLNEQTGSLLLLEKRGKDDIVVRNGVCVQCTQGALKVWEVCPNLYEETAQQIEKIGGLALVGFCAQHGKLCHDIEPDACIFLYQ
jgi:hypothetical protein